MKARHAWLAALACLTALIFLGLAWELVLAPWDVAAGMLMVQEAGGIVTDLDGNPGRPIPGAFVAGNPAMHAWLLQTLKRANMSAGQPE